MIVEDDGPTASRCIAKAIGLVCLECPGLPPSLSDRLTAPVGHAENSPSATITRLIHADAELIIGAPGAAATGAFLIVAKTDDGSGNTAHDCCTVTVPHGTSSESIALANAQAAAARSSCLAKGAAPSSFFLVGEAPPAGPKQ